MDKQNTFDLKTLIQFMEKENHVDRETVITSIEQAVLRAARKSPKVTNDFRVVIDRKELELHMYDSYVVSDEETGTGFITSRKAWIKSGTKHSEGDVIELEIKGAVLGRSVAKLAQQLIKQKIRDAKRTNEIEDNITRIGDIVTGIVSGIDKGDILVQCGNSEMVLPRKEQIRKDNFKIGDTVKAVILEINPKAKHSPVILSRSGNRFLEAVLTKEVAEINDGTIDIVSIVRDPGMRAKICLRSNNDNVDPVGSCVGKGGSRINNIRSYISGERIDIIKYSDNIRDFISQALAPAEIDSVEINPMNPDVVDVVVRDDQYAVAVGRNGQNVNLASKLTGYDINITKSLDTLSFDELKKMSIDKISDTLSISSEDAERIVNAGYLTIDQISDDDVVSFMSSTGLDEVKGRGIHAAATAVSGIIQLS